MVVRIRLLEEDVEELVAERGVIISYEAVRQWRLKRNIWDSRPLGGLVPDKRVLTRDSSRRQRWPVGSMGRGLLKPSLNVYTQWPTLLLRHAASLRIAAVELALELEPRGRSVACRRNPVFGGVTDYWYGAHQPPGPGNVE